MMDQEIPLSRRNKSGVVLQTAQECPPALTRRERDILYWAAHGLIDREIGTTLGISVNTVRTHMQNIIQKLAVANRTHAVALALHLGFVTF